MPLPRGKIIASPVVALISFIVYLAADRRGEPSPTMYAAYALGDMGLHVMCIMAVSFGAELGLKRYVTAQRLTPPEPDPSHVDPPAKPKAKGWRKVLEVVQTIMMLSLPIVPGLGFHLIERYIHSRVLIDSLNIAFQLGFIFFMSGLALHVLCTASSLQLRLLPAIGRKGWRIDDNVEDSTRLKLVAVGMAVAALAASFLGLPRLGYFPAVSWIAAMISMFSLHRLKMRTMVMTLCGVIIIAPLVFVGADAVFRTKEKGDTEQKKSSLMLPSPWIVNVMEVFLFWPPYLISGIFIAMGLRHDYTAAGAPAAVALKGEPGEFVAVPKSIDGLFEQAQPDGSIVKLPKTAYRAGMITVMVTSLICKLYIAVRGLDGQAKSDLEAGLMGMPVPVCLAMLFRKWQVGEFASYWNHSEIWVPPALGSEAVQDVDDVEKTLWDEKAVGTGVSPPAETDTAVVA